MLAGLGESRCRLGPAPEALWRDLIGPRAGAAWILRAHKLMLDRTVYEMVLDKRDKVEVSR